MPIGRLRFVISGGVVPDIATIDENLRRLRDELLDAAPANKPKVQRKLDTWLDLRSSEVEQAEHAASH
jgi:hypothetical protein